jgi:hypothetical protein
MRELIFHLGVPKTGSSALQVFLARNHDLLLARGVDYFRIGDFTLGAGGNISSGNGSLVSRALLPAGSPIGIGDPQPHIDALFAAIDASAADRGVISSEIFADADPPALTRLIERVKEKGIAPRAFFFARRQDQFLSSAYMQEVKRHQCTEFPEVHVRRLYRQVKYLRYGSFFRAMTEVFGAGQVTARLYEEAVANKGGLFQAFLRAIGIDPSGFDMDVKDINTSLTMRSLLMMMLINKYKPRMNFSDFVVQNEITSGAIQSGARHALFSDTLTGEIEAYFQEETAILAREHFARPVLFPPAERGGNTQSISRLSLSVEDAVGFLGGLLVSMDSRVAALEAQVKSLKAGPK